MKKTLLSLFALGTLASCTTVVSSGPDYYCETYFDSWYGEWYEECYYVYYNADGSKQELDISADVADVETAVLEKTASIYAEKFSLSNDQAMKIAKNVKDFNALSDRTESDIADFAQKLYGVNPSEVVSAVANAQIGLNADLDKVIGEAAKNFNTSSDNMKAIVKELHGKALEESGISL